MEPFSASVSNSETVGRGVRGMNLCSGNDVEDNESQSGGQCSRAICLEDEMGGYFVVEEDSGNNYFVHGEDGNGNHLSSQNNENMGGVFFCGDENGGTFLVGEDWSENSAEGEGDNLYDEKVLIASEDDILKMGDLSVFSMVLKTGPENR